MFPQLFVALAVAAVAAEDNSVERPKKQIYSGYYGSGYGAYPYNAAYSGAYPYSAAYSGAYPYSAAYSVPTPTMLLTDTLPPTPTTPLTLLPTLTRTVLTPTAEPTTKPLQLLNSLNLLSISKDLLHVPNKFPIVFKIKPNCP
ncbi:hypothetical protein J6590_035967 [Homalodisca vitripennis]|nr:hypothetical protein J6590_102340 [Homalodisca vitripennis]KAG8306890.1 hypothetical protein J6590_035967 [Homalodisca vitripennis]